jgi:polar amino acid transport system substrate-binding protein
MARIVQLVADPCPPYQYEDYGTLRGVDHDTIVEAFRISGFESRTRLLPWDRCMESMEEGSADGVYQIVKTPKREKQFAFSDLLRTSKTVFYGLKQGWRISSALEFEHRTIGVLAGYSYNSTIDGLKPPRKIEVGNHEQLFLGLREARFEMALMDQGVAEYLFSEYRITDIARFEEYSIERELFVAFQKKRADLAHTFNSGLKRLRSK